MAEKVIKFGPSLKGHYPDEMRRQLWPLCCGVSILSGFKAVHTMTDEELLAEINNVMNAIPDMQVFSYENMKPPLTFLTLNTSQVNSPKIMDAITKSGFTLFAKAKPRGSVQSFFVRDTTKSFELAPLE